MRSTFVFLLILFLCSCSSKLEYNAISSFLNDFTNSVQNKTVITGQNLNVIGPNNFEVELSFDRDENENSKAILYMCNESDSPGCDPRGGQVFEMQRQQTKFVLNKSGLISPFDQGDKINFIIIVEDDDGVEGTVSNSTFQLLDNNAIKIDGQNVSNITSNSFQINLPFSYDTNSNSSALIYYCNETQNPGCDPLLGVSQALTRNSSSFDGVISSITNNIEDDLNILVVISDPDGINSAPVQSLVSLERMAATMIYRSVGVGSTSAIDDNSTGSMNIVGDQATFSSAIASNVGVGDVIVYLADSTLAFITERLSSTNFRVKLANGLTNPASVTGNSDWKIYRAYTSLSEAESGDENTGIPASIRNFDSWSGGKDLVGVNEQWNIALYADGFETADSIVIGGWTTSETNFVKIFSPSKASEVEDSQRHSGHLDYDKYYIFVDASATYARGLRIAVENVIVDGLQIVVNPNGYTHTSGMYVYDNDANDNYNHIYKNNIIHGIKTNSTSIGIHTYSFSSPNAQYRIINNIISNFRSSDCLNTRSRAYIYSNTMVNCQKAITLNSPTILRNNLVALSVDSVRNITNYDTANSGNNIWANVDTPYAATDKVVTSIDFNQENAHDFRLRSTAFSAIGNGADLSSDPHFAFSEDIMGQTRVSWDIGAAQAPLGLFRSVGPTNTSSLKNASDKSLEISINSEGHSILSLSGGSIEIESRVGVGDVFQYDADGIGGVSHLAFIHKRIDANNFYVKNAAGLNAQVTSSGSTTWDVFRAYTSLSSSESGTNENTSIDLALRDFDTWQSASGSPHDLVSKNTQYNIALYGDGAATYIHLSHWITDSLRSVALFSPHLDSQVGLSQRHRGRWDDSKARIINSSAWNGIIANAVKDLTIEGIQAENTASLNSGNVRVYQTSTSGALSNGRVFFLNNIFKNSLTGSGDANDGVIEFGNDYNRNIKKYIVNNIFYGGHRCMANSSAWSPNRLDMYFYHNICYMNSSNAGLQAGGSAGYNQVYIKNTISINRGSGSDYGTFTLPENFEGNISTDSSSPSSASFEGEAPLFLNEALYDFRLRPGDTIAKDRGLDLSDDLFYNVNTDILGNTRSAPFTIGPFNWIDYSATLTHYSDLGSGDSSDPYYIANADQLISFATDCTGGSVVSTCNSEMHLIDDIDLSARSWNPIGDGTTSFKGVIEGNDYTVSNMTHTSSSDFSGFLGNTAGVVIRNITVSGSLNMGWNRFGGIIAGLLGGSAENVTARGSITNCQSSCGGAFGRSNGGSINNALADVDVTGSERLGGLVGASDNTNIDNSGARGDVTGSFQHIGGLVGSGGDNGATYTNTYATGNIKGQSYVGGLIGSYSRSTRLQGCFATGDVVAADNSGESFVGGLIGSMYSATGSQTVENCHAIGDVYGSGDHVGGLVGYIDNAGARAIKNSFAAGNVKGNTNTGGLIGYANTCDIEDSYALGKVTSTFLWAGGLIGRIGGGSTVRSFSLGDVYADRASGNSGAGGFIGAQQSHSVSNSYARGNVVARGDGVAGFIATLNSSSSISNSRSFGSSFGRYNVGGFVAIIGASSSIDSSASYGSVIGNNYIGGFAGKIEISSATISNSYSHGSVSGDDSVGGFVGSLLDGNLTNNYTTSNTVGNTNTYSFIGGSEAGLLNDNFWNADTVGAYDGSSSNASVATSYESQTDNDFMQASTFNSIWDYSASGEWQQKSNLQYPVHKYSYESQCQIGDFERYNDSGSGTLSDPYLICNSYQLQDLVTNGCSEGVSLDCDKVFFLGADIDLKGTDFIGIGGPAQIDAFSGIFDGNGHTISNFRMDTHTSYNALFRYVYNATIRNLNVNNAYANGIRNNSAIAGVLDRSNILNVHVKNSDIRGSSAPSAGGLSAEMRDYSVISHSSYTGEISANSSSGGIVGTAPESSSGHVQKTSAYLTRLFAYGGSIGGILGSSVQTRPLLLRQVFSTGNITGSGLRSGGLAGNQGEVEKSWSSMNLDVSSGCIGGIFGDRGDFTDSYNNTSLVSGNSDVGSLFGCYSVGERGYSVVDSVLESSNPIGEVLGLGNHYSSEWLFFDSSVNTPTFGSYPGDVEKKSTAELMLYSTYASGGADYSMWEHSDGFSNIANSTWLIDDTQKYPLLRWQLHPICQRNFDAKTYNAIGSGSTDDPYIICFKDQLIDLSITGCDSDSSAGCAANYLLLNDIDLEGVDFLGIGHNSNKFSGSFIGNDKTISSVSIDLTGSGNVGFFRSTDGARIENLSFNLISVIADTNVGALIGNSANTFIEDVKIKEATIQAVSGNSAGGMIGISTSSSINDSHFGGDVESSNDLAGGIIGSSTTDILKHTSATGNVSGQRRIGGLIGRAISSSEIHFSHSSNSINLTTNSVGEIGGLVGIGSVIIDHSYSSSTIDSQGNQTGGIIGTLSNPGSISNTYFDGVINSTANASGFVGSILVAGPTITDSYARAQMNVTGASYGFISSNAGTISNCFWDSSKSGVTTGAVLGEYEDRDNTQMTDSTTFSGAGWSGEQWLYIDGQLPLLRDF